MNVDRAINFLLYILGMAFNLAVMAVVVFAIYYAVNRGFAIGSDLAYDIVVDDEAYYEVELVLDVETPATEVSRILEERGVISNRWLFNAELFLMGRQRTYPAGTFVLNRNMSNTQAHNVMRGNVAGLAPEETITIPEGWAIRDMAAYFESRGFFAAEEFIRVADTGHFPFAFLVGIPQRENRLEGYLFPDTYRIPVNPSPGDIITRMLARFDYVFTAAMDTRAYELGLTLDEVVIIASIIEMETRLAHERALVSQVIHNRLAIGKNLEMCSTVAFALDTPRDRLFYVDLEIDSPYNTYIHPGLPVGPIANPGFAALHAALNPAAGDYLFFVLINESTGEHHFSQTYDQHIAANPRRREG
ncbi:MAG: endolytic transglycosylase MltG [Defluviitaleaceae bacterium]|nr:endolytic transglycosylase MltG [Defluviitaleaceae bacterium]